MNDTLPKPTILLVQGAWHHSDVWLPLRGELFKRGYATAVTEFASAGTSPTGSMYDDVEAISDTLAAIDGEVVMVAHSYGGIPATDASSHASNVSQLIYLSAYVPDVNGSMFTLHGIPDPEEATGLFPTINDPLDSLYADVPAGLAAFAASRLIGQTSRSFVDRVRGAGWKTIPTSYIISDNDQAIPPAMQQEMAAHAGATIHHLDSSHSAFLSMPAELADLIDSLVTPVTAAN